MFLVSWYIYVYSLIGKLPCKYPRTISLFVPCYCRKEPRTTSFDCLLYEFLTSCSTGSSSSFMKFSQYSCIVVQFMNGQIHRASSTIHNHVLCFTCHKTRNIVTTTCLLPIPSPQNILCEYQGCTDNISCVQTLTRPTLVNLHYYTTTFKFAPNLPVHHRADHGLSLHFVKHAVS